MRHFYLVLLSASFLVTGAYAQSLNSARTHFDKARALYDEGNYTAARFELQRAGEQAGPNDAELNVLVDFFSAMCAVELDEPNAMAQLATFMRKNPNSVFYETARFAVAKHAYKHGDYATAKAQLSGMDTYNMSSAVKSEYNFMLGSVYFEEEKYSEAYGYFSAVDAKSIYAVHAKYYMSYINYVRGDLNEAKTGFLSLRNDPTYGEAMKFYLLQIEFLQENYDYVIANGDELIRISTRPRAKEVARVMAESYYRTGNYKQAVEYIRLYGERLGGEMGREENYILGYSYFVDGDLGPAVEALAKVCGPSDNLTQNAAYNMGAAYIMMGNKRAAMQAFSMAVADGTDAQIREDALFNYGKLQYELGGGVFNEAINALTRYITEYPGTERTEQAREYLIAAYYNLRNYESAYEAISQFPDPDNNMKAAMQRIAYYRALEYYEAGDTDSALKLLEQAGRYNYSQKYTALSQFWRGEILYRKGAAQKAVPYFSDYIKVSPASEREYKMAQYNLGYSYFDMQKWKDAGTWFTRFVASYKTQDRYRADAYNRLGDVSYSQRDFAEAINNYNRAYAIGTDEKYYAQYQRAVMEGFRKQPARKIEQLKGIISAGHGDYVDDATYELGRTYIGQSDFNDGAKMLKQYVANYPSGVHYLDALSDLGLVYLNLGDNKQALGYYKQVVEKNPSSSQAKDALLGIRGIYVDMNDVDSYFSYARNVGVETDLGAVQRDSLAYAAAFGVYMSGNAKRTSEAMKSYLDSYPRGNYRPDAWYYLGTVYTQLGDNARALEAFGALTQMFDNDYTVRGLQRMAALLYDAKDYPAASETYKRLSESVSQADERNAALGGYLDSWSRSGDDSRLIEAANEVLASAVADKDLTRRATYYKAKALHAEGKGEAMALFRKLSAEPQTVEGAEAAYIVIASTFAEGDMDKTEHLVFDLSDSNTPHTYWLGKSFLMLGDLYVAKGDTFQARATYQSIVDGYSPANDGIVEQAKFKIESLK